MSYLGLGALRIQPLGYNWWDGSARYRSEDFMGDWAGLPHNCVGPGTATPSDLPADGGSCFTAFFPFIGRKQYGCATKSVEGGIGEPYVKCVPVILKGEGFDFISPILRIVITAAIAWVGYGALGGKK